MRSGSACGPGFFDSTSMCWRKMAVILTATRCRGPDPGHPPLRRGPRIKCSALLRARAKTAKPRVALLPCAVDLVRRLASRAPEPGAAEEAPMSERSAAERVWAPCRFGRGAQGTGDGFIVPGAAPAADGFGYFCRNKSNQRASAEAFDFLILGVDPAKGSWWTSQYSETPSGCRLNRRWIHRYCAGAARAMVSMPAITLAVSAVASADGKSSSIGHSFRV